MVGALDEIEHEICECGHGFVVVAVASFESVYAESGELVELSLRHDVSLAA